MAAPCITGEELEVMMSEWDTPLVIDAYATWCGPCVIMAPEFEAAAKELKGKVRMVKLDTDKNEEMAARLNVQGLPTLLFLDKFERKEGEEPKAAAVLKGKIEGAMRNGYCRRTYRILLFRWTGTASLEWTWKDFFEAGLHWPCVLSRMERAQFLVAP